jgi:hypothetical protein
VHGVLILDATSAERVEILGGAARASGSASPTAGRRVVGDPEFENRPSSKHLHAPGSNHVWRRRSSAALKLDHAHPLWTFTCCAATSRARRRFSPASHTRRRVTMMVLLAMTDGDHRARDEHSRASAPRAQSFSDRRQSGRATLKARTAEKWARTLYDAQRRSVRATRRASAGQRPGGAASWRLQARRAVLKVGRAAHGVDRTLRARRHQGDRARSAPPSATTAEQRQRGLRRYLADGAGANLSFRCAVW